MTGPVIVGGRGIHPALLGLIAAAGGPGLGAIVLDDNALIDSFHGKAERLRKEMAADDARRLEAARTRRARRNARRLANEGS